MVIPEHLRYLMYKMSEDTVAKIIKTCQGEVDDVKDLTCWRASEDKGRKEFAQQILNLISTIYKRKIP